MHAQSRLFGMELKRRAGSGTLSEIFGSATLKDDKMLRIMRIRAASEETIATLTPLVLEGLESYAKGVNDYVNNVGTGFGSNSGHLLPPEFYLFGIEW